MSGEKTWNLWCLLTRGSDVSWSQSFSVSPDALKQHLQQINTVTTTHALMDADICTASPTGNWEGRERWRNEHRGQGFIPFMVFGFLDNKRCTKLFSPFCPFPPSGGLSTWFFLCLFIWSLNNIYSNTSYEHIYFNDHKPKDLLYLSHSGEIF